MGSETGEKRMKCEIEELSEIGSSFIIEKLHTFSDQFCIIKSQIQQMAENSGIVGAE